MTSDTPYIRNTLTATHQGIPDPSSLVDLWLDQFLEAVAADLLGEPYDCLALFGRLQRCRPDLIAATGRQQTWQTACEQVRTNLADLAERAASVPDPNGWLREASSLADACDEGVGDAELTDWAAELLADLDDADLIAWALGPGSNDALEEGLGRCHAWLADNPDRFFPAGVLVQGIGHALGRIYPPSMPT
ncbi:MAG: hypothetical protein U0840_12370 [Gemmataceae bacterium]